jgi:hypothetical protein
MSLTAFEFLLLMGWKRYSARIAGLVPFGITLYVVVWSNLLRLIWNGAMALFETCMEEAG